MANKEFLDLTKLCSCSPMVMRSVCLRRDATGWSGELAYLQSVAELLTSLPAMLRPVWIHFLKSRYFGCKKFVFNTAPVFGVRSVNNCWDAFTTPTVK